MIDSEAESKYIVYKIGEELYASPLLSVREVIEYQKPKFIPNMVNYFSGVINVRGTIVGVVDFRAKFNLPNKVDRKTSLLLCDSTEGPVAALVDSVESVIEILENDLEKNPPVKTQIEKTYMIGVAKYKDKLITVIDILKSLSEEHLKIAV